MTLLGKTTPDLAGQILKTGYDRFQSPTGIDGLCRVTGKRLDLLAVFAAQEGKGQFRNFIAKSKKEFETIRIYEIWNPTLKRVFNHLTHKQV